MSVCEIEHLRFLYSQDSTTIRLVLSYGIYVKCMGVIEASASNRDVPCLRDASAEDGFLGCVILLETVLTENSRGR
jgi:hypothetical protein